MLRALREFSDMQDNSFHYNAGDIFPREGVEVSPERIKELLSADNKLGEPVIEEIKQAKAEPAPVETPEEEQPKPKKRGRKANAD